MFITAMCVKRESTVKIDLSAITLHNRLPKRASGRYIPTDRAAVVWSQALGGMKLLKPHLQVYQIHAREDSARGQSK